MLILEAMRLRDEGADYDEGNPIHPASDGTVALNWKRDELEE